MISSAEYQVTREEDQIRVTIGIPQIDFARYFPDGFQDDRIPKEALENILHQASQELQGSVQSITYRENTLQVILMTDEEADACAKRILTGLQRYLEEQEAHITRMFGSFVYLKRIDGELTAVYATPIPLQYCPLMKKLLLEIGGDTAAELLKRLPDQEQDSGTLMCQLINEVVIRGGYFDTSRPLNSCETNVLFGASETMSSAFSTGMIDAAVIVSNNLGTIITTSAEGTQGAVRRMTGLFATSPSRSLQKIAAEAGIIPVFPHTAAIDQLAGVRMAIALGYRRIAVSVAWKDNAMLDEIRALEKDGVEIVIFSLCSTGLPDDTAEILGKNADMVWACASRAVQKYVEPAAVAQVGVKIPVYILTNRGWKMVENHLQVLARNRGETVDFSEVKLEPGEKRPVILNGDHGFTAIQKEKLRPCTDCPYPCQ